MVGKELIEGEVGNEINLFRDPRRAKDFVKCLDPECRINVDWRRWHGRFPNDVQRPHCHPVF